VSYILPKQIVLQYASEHNAFQQVRASIYIFSFWLWPARGMLMFALRTFFPSVVVPEGKALIPRLHDGGHPRKTSFIVTLCPCV
jgi:hypothetical protein